MKKITFLFSCLCAGISFTISAQDTIKQADMPTAGTATIYATDSVLSVTPGNKGAGQTWNYASVTAQTSAIDSFVSPSSTPYASSFPAANLADTTIGNSGVIFIKSSASEFGVVGIEANYLGYIIKIPIAPDFIQIPLPAYIGITDGGVSKGSDAIPVSYGLFDSAKVKAQITYADTVDANGTMTIPMGTFTAVRQKHYELDIDSLFVRSVGGWAFYKAQVTKTFDYRWYTHNIGDILVTMTTDSTYTKAQKVIWYDGIPNGINELSVQHNTLVYPNPCSNQITFRYNAQTTQYVAVYDMTGRKLSQVEMKNGTLNLNTSTYANGLYLFRVLDKSGNVLSNGKFLVQQ